MSALNPIVVANGRKKTAKEIRLDQIELVASSEPATPGSGVAVFWLEKSGATSRLKIKFDDGSIDTISVSG